MSTFMAKTKELERKWYIIDAAGKPLGRVAATAAVILRGKHKPTFTPNVDCGEFVIIINTDKAVLTGRKLDQKMWYRHSGYVGGLKAIQYRSLMATRSDKAMMLAVQGMLPHNSLGRAALRKLRVYKNDKHGHQAQQPVMWEHEIK
ncbi:MAG: 50S ribosomal protein L13 [Clostridiaceae bacterium]|nr:50S ribosomal protein L13 [Clostridiaceae bacterium]